MDIIAIRVHHSNKNKPVYEATKAEWDEFFEKTFNTEDELLNDVLKWSKAKNMSLNADGMQKLKSKNVLKQNYWQKSDVHIWSF